MRTTVKTPKRKRAQAPAATPASADTPEVVAEVSSQTAAEPPSMDSASAMIALPSVCTVKDAAALKAQLCKVVDEAADVCLDIRSVERVDTAIFQLLFAFVRDRSARKLGVTWLGAPAAMLDAATLLGLRASLNLPEKESLGVAA